MCSCSCSWCWFLCWCCCWSVSFFFETLTLVGLTPLELLVKHFSKISEGIDARSEALPLVVHHTESVVAHRRARGAPFAGKKQDVSFCTWRSERPVASHGAALSCVAPSVVRGPSVVTAPRCASRPLMRLAGFSGLNYRKGTFCLKPLRPQNECQRMIRTQMPVWTPVANHGSSRWRSCSSTSRRGGCRWECVKF